MESLYTKLNDYSKKNITPLHMPGGKRNPELFGFPDPFMMDITEIDGFDNLHNPSGILKYEMDRAARLFGSGESLICVNGSTSGLISAVCGAFSKGDRVLVARNCHICIINAIIMRELDPLFLYPKKDENGIYKALSLDDVVQALRSSPDVKGLIMTSPTYEGVVSDTEAIASFLHANDKLLIVDEAHGAHFYFSDTFPKGAVSAGADLVVNSLHKTLPALTQTALLHINGDLVNRERVRAFWNMNQTTSPSYVLMGSISACFDLLDSTAGRELMNKYTEGLINLRGCLCALNALKLFESDDPGKIVITAGDGRRLCDIFLNKYDIQLEMAAKHYVVAMTSPADNEEYYERFINACKEADKVFDAGSVSRCDTGFDIDKDNLPELRKIKHKQAMPPHIAFEKLFTDGERVLLNEAEGHICLENVIVYPPGTPVLVAGEVIEKEDIDIICDTLKDGGEVIGVREGSIYVTYN